jgi:hypothetical protein
MTLALLALYVACIGAALVFAPNPRCGARGALEAFGSAIALAVPMLLVGSVWMPWMLVAASWAGALIFVLGLAWVVCAAVGASRFERP